MKDIISTNKRLGWECFEECDDIFENKENKVKYSKINFQQSIRSIKLDKVVQKNLLELQLCGWYWKSCDSFHFDSEMSTKILAPHPPGTFLIRDSSDPRHLFTLSVQTTRGPTSVRLVHRNGTFSLDAADERIILPKCTSVIGLVQSYVKSCNDRQVWVDTISGRTHSPVNLTKPLRRSVPSLKHLCRVALNVNGVINNCVNSQSNIVPKSIQEYVQKYPYTL